MISKATTGFEPFDRKYGGLYGGRTALVSGRSGSGKTLFALGFLHAGAQQAERGLLLTTRSAQEVLQLLEVLRLPLGRDLSAGHVLLLEYSLPERGAAAAGRPTLPPDGFLQFSDMVQSHGVQRIVLDTVTPWVAIPGLEQMSEHVLSFVRACDRLGTTTLYTLPRPRSPSAIGLRRQIEDLVPIALELETGPDSNGHQLTIRKYLGQPRAEEPLPFVIRPGAGLAPAHDAPPSPGPPAAGLGPGFADIMKPASRILSG